MAAVARFRSRCNSFTRAGRSEGLDQYHGLQEQASRRDSGALRQGIRRQETRAAAQELDGIVTADHHYLLEWSAPYQRMVYWNKFGQPQGVITRIGDYRDVRACGGSIPRKTGRWKKRAAIHQRSSKSGRPTTSTGWSSPSVERNQVTGYFLRRLLLIIPTFIGITMAVFVVMHFVPGGPIERQIMAYKMAVAQRRRRRRRSGSSASRSRRKRSRR